MIRYGYVSALAHLAHAANPNLQKCSGILASSILGFMAVVGIFNRITFPAFLVLPATTLLPHFQRKSVCPPSLSLSALD